MSSPKTANAVPAHEGPVAGPAETLRWFLERSKRAHAVPVHTVFVQQRARNRGVPSVLAEFVRARRDLALELYLLCLMGATSEPHTISRPSFAWARALGLAPTRTTGALISKQWRWLEERRLVERSRGAGNVAVIGLLREDGSGDPFRPTIRGGQYFQIPLEYWTQNWRGKLTLPEKAILLIGLSLSDDFYLPNERAKEWYGVSADTCQRGLAGLSRHGLLFERVFQKAAPASPIGYTRQHHYTLMRPFGPKGVRSETVQGLEIWRSHQKPPRRRRAKARAGSS